MTAASARRLAGVVLLGTSLTASPAAAAESAVVIEHVMAFGRMSWEARPLPVRMRVVNPSPREQALELRIDVYSGGLPHVPPAPAPLGPRTGRLVTTVSLAGGEARSLSLPVLARAQNVIEVAAYDSRGAALGGDRRVVPAWGLDLVALACAPDAVCRQLKSIITSAGTDEDRVERRRALAVEPLLDLPERWWEYTGVAVVILARPMNGLTAAQREAVELFARHGGRLVLVEDLLGDDAFLRAYRGGGAGVTRAIGGGTLLAVRSPAHGAIPALFVGDGLKRIISRAALPDDLRWGLLRDAHQWLAAPLRFPTLLALSLWLIGYVAAVGVVNFTVLQRLGRPEWGWMTVPAVSLVFAVALYGVSVAGRPRAIVLDEIGVYWMDDRSGLAADQAAVRVSVPRAASLRVLTERDAIFSGPEADATWWSPIMALRAATGVERGWSAGLGAEQEMSVDLPHWSFRDLRFRGVRRLAGTVHRTAQSRLKNETGLDFTDMVYLDHAGARRLGAVRAGAEVEVSAQASPTGQGATTARRHGGRPAEGAFDLLELARTWRGRGLPSPAILALADTSAVGARLSDGRPHPGRRACVVVVSLAR